ncbi:M90 family metallopeptidase [Paraglaciecola sp. 25GB23A]|uniref:M90 family metallopeptidase n=1 Tax=Paraglaciecola sp. 25GB23A TaxID=3156068 RepID=UPI0032AEAB01
MRQTMIYCLLSLPLIGMFLWYYFEARSKVARGVRREKLRSQGIPVEWQTLLSKEFALYNKLPQNLQLSLTSHMQVFLDEKDIVGRNGFAVDDRVKILIAAQACLLIINRPGDYYPGFRTILVYPETYVANSTRTEGMLHITSTSARAGESWRRGPVILAWDHVIQGARDSRDGHNVVMHEFAHKLDEENAAMDGLPLLPTLEQYKQWSEVLSAEFTVQQQKFADGIEDIIDSYGATSPAEFFAVVTETFFEKPQQLHRLHPALYEQFKQCYMLDPLNWLS